MAKKSMINREIKREKTVVKYAAKRAELKKSMLDLSLTVEEREAAAIKFHRLPRNASPVRKHNRKALLL